LSKNFTQNTGDDLKLVSIKWVRFVVFLREKAATAFSAS